MRCGVKCVKDMNCINLFQNKLNRIVIVIHRRYSGDLKIIPKLSWEEKNKEWPKVFDKES